MAIENGDDGAKKLTFPESRIHRKPEEVQTLKNKERAESERLELEDVVFTIEDKERIMQILDEAKPRIAGNDIAMKNRFLNEHTPLKLQNALGYITDVEIIDTPDYARAVALACEQLMELQKALRKPGE